MKPRTDKIEYGDTNNNYIKLVKNDIVEAKKIADIVVACPTLEDNLILYQENMLNF